MVTKIFSILFKSVVDFVFIFICSGVVWVNGGGSIFCPFMQLFQKHVLNRLGACIEYKLVMYIGPPYRHCRLFHRLYVSVNITVLITLGL